MICLNFCKAQQFIFEKIEKFEINEEWPAITDIERDLQDVKCNCRRHGGLLDNTQNFGKAQVFILKKIGKFEINEEWPAITDVDRESQDVMRNCR